MSQVSLQQFEQMPHGQKQEFLARLPVEYGGQLLDQLHGHEYEDDIRSLIPQYCENWSYLKAGGEPEAIVLAGRAGRLYGMVRIAGDPFKYYTSGSAFIVQERIVLLVKAEYLFMIRQGWEVEQEQELRDPSLSLDDCVSSPDGEEEYPYETIPDTSRFSDPVDEMLATDALRTALSGLTPGTRAIVLEMLSGKELRTIAVERGQEYGTVRNRVWRAMNELREELSRGEEPRFDKEAAIADGYRRLLHKIFEDLPP